MAESWLTAASEWTDTRRVLWSKILLQTRVNKGTADPATAPHHTDTLKRLVEKTLIVANLP